MSFDGFVVKMLLCLFFVYYAKKTTGRITRVHKTIFILFLFRVGGHRRIRLQSGKYLLKSKLNRLSDHLLVRSVG